MTPSLSQIENRKNQASEMIAEVQRRVPYLFDSEVVENQIKARKEMFYSDGILADLLRSQSSGFFCSWGGLDPDKAVGVCPSCGRCDDFVLQIKRSFTTHALNQKQAIR